MSIFNEVRQMVGEVLQLGERVENMCESSALLGSIPEFDSMAVVTVITALEDNYGFIVDDDEVEASTFETFGSLAKFVQLKLGE